MPTSQALAPHLPYLRRYARALTGAQDSGDAYVRAALTAVVSGEEALDADLSPRVAEGMKATLEPPPKKSL